MILIQQPTVTVIGEPVTIQDHNSTNLIFSPPTAHLWLQYSMHIISRPSVTLSWPLFAK